MNWEFWRNKRVFLTGHTGFKGAWTSLWLNSLGAKVFGYSLEAPTTPSLYEVCRVNRLVEEKIGDIRHFETLQKAMKDFQPDIVLHLAAQSLVRYSYDHPLETFETNILGTANLLQAMRNIPTVGSAVMVTTDKCYENVESSEVSYKETDPMGGHDPYSASKGCAELVVSAMRRSYFPHGEPPIATARAGNVIGGGDWALDRLVPDFVRCLSQGKKVHIRHPKAIRPWQHVLEPVRGYLLLAERLYLEGLDYAQAWNFGPFESEARSVEYIGSQFSKLWGKEDSWFVSSGLSKHEAHYLKLNIDKAINKLKWTPLLNIDKAIRLTAEWYKAYYARGGEDMFDLTMDQIGEYQEQIT